VGRSYKERVRKRTIWLFFILSLLYAGLVGRLVYVQLYNAAHYKKWANSIRLRDISILASRGTIYDRAGRVLAVSIDSTSIYVNRRELEQPARTIAQVAAILGEDPTELRRRVDNGHTIVWLSKKIDPRLADKLRKSGLSLPGVGFEREPKRVYPTGALAAQILGFTGFDGSGREGIERVLDDLLRGKDGLVRAELDARRRIIPHTRHVLREPEQGKSVFLTIDTTIQHMTEQALAKMARQYRPNHACAIVMDPRTGEILALANYPTYDPNRPASASPEVWRNRAVADLYEPGSTLKVLTVAAGLNEGMSPSSVLAYCTGREKMRGGVVTCPLHHPFEKGHGAVDMYKVIQHSCNIGAAHIAMRLGAEKMRSYERAFGLLDRIEAGFGCESVGYVEPAKNWHPIRLANMGFGQGIAVTPLQMACLYSTVANGGVFVQPQILREVRNPDGSLCRSFQPKRLRRVISQEAAREITKMLVRCVEDGTGKAARVEGRTVAGKTGSAQIPRVNGRGYEPGAFVASFIGFAPAYKPRLVIAVVVHRPQGSHWGATVAAPVFREIAEKALWYLKVPVDSPTTPCPKPKRQKDSESIV
jgi:stage V sporulation protein D (sporulation-specific penicillin-binding protein)